VAVRVQRGAVRDLAVVVVLFVVLVVGVLLVSGVLHRDDPANPPETISWHSCAYRRLAEVQTLRQATEMEHLAFAYRNMQLQHIGDDGGLPIYGLPVGLDNPNACNRPWLLHLRVGADRYQLYQGPGGP
jgi:hypothetical protein